LDIRGKFLWPVLETEKTARLRYAEFVSDCEDMRKHPDLAGGGLVRSAGSRTEIEKVRAEGARIKGDERILGSSEFMQQVLKATGEQMDHKAELMSKCHGRPQASV